MMLVNSSFLCGVHAHIAREKMLTRHAMLLSVFYNPWILCFQPRTVHHEWRSMVRA